MRGDKGPANRGSLTLIGGVMMAVVVGAAYLLDPEGTSELGAALQEAQERSEASQTAPAVRAESRAIPAKSTTPARSSGSGDDAPFDYYLLALSWSPSFCETRPDSDQCGKGLRFVMHGLWPQYERGYPENCYTAANRRVPGRLLRAYRDLAPSQGLLAHQWRKHGSCAGMSAEQYFQTARAARQRIAIPQALKNASKSARLDPRVIETAFLQANPGLDRDEVTITCSRGDLAEVRVCLSRDLEPRRCGADVIRDCSQRMVDLPAPK